MKLIIDISESIIKAIEKNHLEDSELVRDEVRWAIEHGVTLPDTMQGVTRGIKGFNTMAWVYNAPKRVICDYIVARRGEFGELWYYGQYDELKKATEVAIEIENGIVVTRAEAKNES